MTNKLGTKPKGSFGRLSNDKLRQMSFGMMITPADPRAELRALEMVASGEPHCQGAFPDEWFHNKKIREGVQAIEQSWRDQDTKRGAATRSEWLLRCYLDRQLPEGTRDGRVR